MSDQPTNTMDLEDRFIGAMLGHALGDALAAPFEGVPGDVIARDLGGAHRLLRKVPNEVVPYTDDTQMMIGVAECLVHRGFVDQGYLVERFVANYQDWRGYGQGARRLLESVVRGGQWRDLLTSVFPDGSFGNGAAMRVTPVGLFCHGDSDQLEEFATLSAGVTHTHPYGVEGAVLFAAAVSEALLSPPTFDRAAFFEAVARHATTEEFQWQLRTASRLTNSDAIPFGNSLPAHRSVVSALCCFARSPDSFLDAITSAVSMGDDTDTLAGMAGALVGARHGCDALPRYHLMQLEDGPQGRQYIEQLGRQLHARCCSRR